MRVAIEFAFHPDWHPHALGLGFGADGLLASAEADIPEIDGDEAPPRYTVRDRDGRTHVLREHAGALYEPIPRVPQGLPLASLLAMDFRPRRGRDGGWEMAFDRSLPAARAAAKRLECVSRACADMRAWRASLPAHPGDLRAREAAAVSAILDSGLAIVGGSAHRRLASPCLVLFAGPGFGKRLCVSLTPESPSARQEVFPFDAYEAALSTLRAAGGRDPERCLVARHEDAPPAPGPR